MLKQHPRFAEDFKPPEGVRDPLRYQVGRSGYWPDVARRQPRYNRPDWCPEQAKTLDLDTHETDVLIGTTAAPADATLDTKGLHASAAIDLCRRVMRDREASSGDGALALC